MGGGGNEEGGDEEDVEDGCLGAGGVDAPWGARRGSVFLVPILSSAFFVVLGSCLVVTVCMAVVCVETSLLGLLIMEVIWWPHHGGRCAPTGQRFEEPPLFPETCWGVCERETPMK